MRVDPVSIRLTAALAICSVTALVSGPCVFAQHATVLHSFASNSKDGNMPYAGLVFDAAGNLYGTTSYGGVHGVGTVFELTRTGHGNWTEKVLHGFSANGTDGYNPYSGVILDSAGNLYGTTAEGGSFNAGTVFELTPTDSGGWVEEILHSFNPDGTDGVRPFGGLFLDCQRTCSPSRPFGNLYGTTRNGGAKNIGTVFELTPTQGGVWTEKILHSFASAGKDGYLPYSALVADAKGNLYGTTTFGGVHGFGTVFELIPTTGGIWTESILHSFNYGNTDGYEPYAGLIFDAAGDLYGTTSGGGAYGGGTVFALIPINAGGEWDEKVLYSFSYNSNHTDGQSPNAGLVFDASGNLYGTTTWGGAYNHGTVFEMKPLAGGDWTERILLIFNAGGSDGQWPDAGLLFDAFGNLYGTTFEGGSSGVGTVFEITP
jgi:uncharacterized repeat protein (TIGR03803 family)